MDLYNNTKYTFDLNDNFPTSINGLSEKARYNRRKRVSYRKRRSYLRGKSICFNNHDVTYIDTYDSIIMTKNAIYIAIIISIVSLFVKIYNA